MGYIEQGCTLNDLRHEGNSLWLSARCPKNDGTFRTSKIDLNLCIGPQSGVLNGGLEALGAYKPVTLTHGGGQGNHNGYRDFMCWYSGKVFRCEKEMKPGAEGLLPWKWGEGSKWEWREFDLEEYLFNADGTLEFRAPIDESAFPEWVHESLEKLAEIVEEAEEEEDKPPLAKLLDEMSKELIAEKLKSLGWEENAIEWLEGTKKENGKIVRVGT